MIALNSFETVQKAFVMAKEDLSEILSGKIRKTFICFYMYWWKCHIAFEFWDHESVDVVKSQMMDQSNYPIEGKHAFYALIETQGSNREHDQEVK